MKLTQGMRLTVLLIMAFATVAVVGMAGAYTQSFWPLASMVAGYALAAVMPWIFGYGVKENP